MARAAGLPHVASAAAAERARTLDCAQRRSSVVRMVVSGLALPQGFLRGAIVCQDLWMVRLLAFLREVGVRESTADAEQHA